MKMIEMLYCSKCKIFPSSEEIGTPVMFGFTSIKIHLKTGCFQVLELSKKSLIGTEEK